MRDKGIGCILPRELHRRPVMSYRGQLAQEISRKFPDCTEVLAFPIEYLGGLLAGIAGL